MKKAITVLMIGIQLCASAQDTLKLDSSTKEEIVKSTALILKNKYVFPDIGKRMAEYITAQYYNDEYQSYSEVKALCTKLTSDLRTITNDKHLWIYYDPEEAREILADKKLLPKDEIKKIKEAYYEWYRRQNYGFQKTEILDGNIGYLKIDYFSNMNGAETCFGAMAFLANTDAIIIDLRDNGGGESIGSFLSSYFFSSDTILLGSVIYRDSTQNQSNWTLPYVPGKRMPDKVLYILTSSRTFSAAEGFTYNLQQLKRAIVVGETTKGGAHPIDVFIVKDNILAQVPIGRSYNPISKTNWEGIGVNPDIKTASDDAFNTAYVMALDSLIKRETDESTIFKLDWAKKGIAHYLKSIDLNEKELKEYAGQYGNKIIKILNKELYFLPGNQSDYKMIPLENDLFMLEGIDYIRLQFEKDKLGKITKLIVLYDDGSKQNNERK